MIKKTLRGVGRVLKPLVNFPHWMRWGDLKENNHMITSLAKGMLKADTAVPRQETYEEAVVRLNLNDEAIAARKKDLFLMAGFFSVLAIAVFIYGFYLLLFQGMILAFFMGVALAFLLTALAFRQHFWYIQMKYKRLGLTFNDWMNYTFKKGGTSHGTSV